MDVYGLVRVSEDDVVIAIAGVFESDLRVSLVASVPESNIVAVSIGTTVLMKDMVVVSVQGRDNVEITSMFGGFEVPLEVVLVDVTPSGDVGTVGSSTSMNMYEGVSTLALYHEGFP